MARGAIKGITVEIAGNTTKLQNALKSVDGSLSKTQSALKDINGLLKFDSDNSELLRQKQEYLAQAIEQTEKRLQTLRAASEQAAEGAANYDAYIEKLQPIQDEIASTKDRLKELQESAKEAEEQLAAGEISKEQYDAIQQEIKSTKDHLKELQEAAKACSDEFGNPISPEAFNTLQREIAATEGNLRKYQDQLDEMNTDKLTDEMEEAGEQSSIFGDMLKANLSTEAIIGGIKKLCQALKDLYDETVEYGDNVDKMSQKMGMSAEAYQEWDFIMQHCGTTMSSLKTSMKTLASAAETGNAAFAELGISQEMIASMSEEELFGATITALQNVTDTTKRTYLAGKTLGRGATELGALLNKSAEETQAMRDRIHELGGVMSDQAVADAAAYKDAVQDLKTAWGGFAREATQDWIPVLTTLGSVLADGIAGLSRTEWTIDEYGQLSPILHDSAKASQAAAAGLKSATAAGEKFLAHQAKIADRVSAYSETQEGAFMSVANSARDAIASGEGLRETYDALTVQMAALEEGTDSEAAAIARQALQILNLAATNRELTGSYPEYIQALNDTGYSVTQLSAYLIDNGITADEWAGRVKSATDGVINGFQTLDTSLDMSLDDMYNNLQANITAYQTWESNIQTLMARAMENGSAGQIAFVQQLQSMGIGAAEQVAAMMSDVDGTLERFGPLMEEAGAAGVVGVYNGIESDKAQVTAAAEGVMSDAEAAMEAVEGFEAAGQGKMDETAQGVESGSGEVSAAVAAALTSAKSAGEAVGGWTGLGFNISSGIAAGVRSGGGLVSSAVRSIIQSALEAGRNEAQVNSPSKLFRDKLGAAIPEGTAQGVTRNSGMLGDAVKSMVQGGLEGGRMAMAGPTGLAAVGSSGTAIGGTTNTYTTNMPGVAVNVYAAEGQDVRQIARAVETEIYLQMRKAQGVYGNG